MINVLMIAKSFKFVITQEDILVHIFRISNLSAQVNQPDNGSSHLSCKAYLE
jgi:hypothetical protein